MAVAGRPRLSALWAVMVPEGMAYAGIVGVPPIMGLYTIVRVGTALTEGTANFLVSRRMAKSQQMPWSRRGADRLLRVRCAVYNPACRHVAVGRSGL